MSIHNSWQGLCPTRRYTVKVNPKYLWLGNSKQRTVPRSCEPLMNLEIPLQIGHFWGNWATNSLWSRVILHGLNHFFFILGVEWNRIHYYTITLLPAPDDHGWWWVWSNRWNCCQGKPATVPHCPPQIPHYLTWARIRAVAVGSRRIRGDKPPGLWHGLDVIT
jgi:hypothetical protein